MTCKFKGTCGRPAVAVCSLCGDAVCLEHSAPRYHFNSVAL